VLLVTVAAFVANIVLQCLGTLAALRLGMRSAITVGLMTGNCNMGIVLVALADEAPFDTVMFFALGQIPMYMLPALMLPLYRRIAGPSV